MTGTTSIDREDHAANVQGRGIAERVLGHALAGLAHGRLEVDLPGGGKFVRAPARPGPEARFSVNSWKAFGRIAFAADIGFAEGYIAGEWTTPDLTQLLELFARNNAEMRPGLAGTRTARFVDRVVHGLRANTRGGSRRNIRVHYDLGNPFYALWLDKGMQYSSALFDPAVEGDDLEQAQQRKLDRIETLLGAEPGARVLEIGCGWGALAERLAAGGAAVAGISLSERQLDYARARLAAAGLAADLRLQDYRDVDGGFDRIVSIEMIEAVGEAYWPAYFSTLRDRLAPGGRAVVQAITIDEPHFDHYRRTPDFIQRYIFPGGMLPTLEVIRSQAARVGLRVASVESFGASYAQTLREWRNRFLANWPKIAALGFDDRFRRMWEYYLCYCEAGFRAATIDVRLVVMER